MPRFSAVFVRFLAVFAWLSTGAITNARAEPPRRPCAVSDPELARAERELTQLDDAIAALDVAADPKPLLARIEALESSRCLAMSDGLSHAAENGLSLKTYWAEGGSEYLRSYLNLAKSGEHWLWLAPSVRRALTRETQPASVLRELLCPFDDASCGAETRGWAIRAEHEFDALAMHAKSPPADELSKDGELLDCEQVARRAAPKDRFAKFRSCEEARRIARTALPLGHLRAPDHGWLTIEGRRGHYAFCDETRAYDLATGSAYRVASCGGLVLQSGGNVDFRATDAGRTKALEMGHLPLMAVREAAWMLLLVDEVDHDVVEGYGIGLPNTLPLTVDEGNLLLGLSQTWHTTSADTRLRWHVETNSKVIKQGDLTWSPQALDDAASEHAVTLLRVAEAGLVEDCPEVPPPASVFRRSPELSANQLDADSASLDSAAKEVSENWREIAERQRLCAKARLPNRVVSAAPKSAPPR